MEGRTLARDTSTFHPDLSSHRFYQATRDIEAQPRTPDRTVNVTFQSQKTLEETSLILDSYPLPFIGDTNHHALLPLIANDAGREGKRRGWGRIFQSIRAEIEQNLAQMPGIGLYCQARRYIQ